MTIEQLNGIMLVVLAAAILWEIRGYYKFIQAANQLNILGTAVQAAFEGVVKDIATVNQELTVTSLRSDRNDEAIDILNQNDAVIEIYLNLFRDALSIEADKLSRVGTIKHPDTNS